MNAKIHLTSMMSEEMADFFLSEIIKALNHLTFNGQRKVIYVRKFGNSIAVGLEPFGRLPKESYKFSLGDKIGYAIEDKTDNQ